MTLNKTRTTTARLAATAIAIAGTALATLPQSAFADNLRWKMPVAFSTNLPGLGTPAAWVAEQLTTASDGSIQVKVFEPGKLVPPFEILQSVSDGKVSAGYTWIGYDQGKVPAVPLFAAVPFGLKPWSYAGWYMYGGGHDMLQEVYKNKGFNVHAQFCGIIGPETAGWYKEPIKSLVLRGGTALRAGYRGPDAFAQKRGGSRRHQAYLQAGETSCIARGAGDGAFTPRGSRVKGSVPRGNSGKMETGFPSTMVAHGKPDRLFRFRE